MTVTISHYTLQVEPLHFDIHQTRFHASNYVFSACICSKEGRIHEGSICVHRLLLSFRLFVAECHESASTRIANGRMHACSSCFTHVHLVICINFTVPRKKNTYAIKFPLAANFFIFSILHLNNSSSIKCHVSPRICLTLVSSRVRTRIHSLFALYEWITFNFAYKSLSFGKLTHKI